ncbi:MAG: beta-lactamase family protein [Cytophagales bacterium]|nr:beta-lactamase family protein [Cytophagales bacterium]
MKNPITAFLLALAPTVNAQTKSLNVSPSRSPASAASVGMFEERLNRIDVICKETIENTKVPGIVALVARRGKVVFQKACGFAEKSIVRKMKTNDIFRIASQRNTNTSKAVIVLWEEGKFRLDD